MAQQVQFIGRRKAYGGGIQRTASFSILKPRAVNSVRKKRIRVWEDRRISELKSKTQRKLLMAKPDI